MIPDLNALVTAVLASSSHHDSVLHGVGHWKCVAWTGVQLARDVKESDAEIAFLFGLIHDSQRLDDGDDPEHGPRAAEFAKRLNGNLFELSAVRSNLLTTACHDHTHAVRSDDPTIGVCFDADRLNLCRLGITIDRKFLSTTIARQPATVEAATSLSGQRMEWQAIYEAAISGRKTEPDTGTPRRTR
jgi:uncharacterized protein